MMASNIFLYQKGRQYSLFTEMVGNSFCPQRKGADEKRERTFYGEWKSEWNEY